MRTFGAKIKPRPASHGSRLREIVLEACEQFVESSLTAKQQGMDMAPLRDPRTGRRLRRKRVALEDNHLFKKIGEGPRCGQPT